MVAIKPRNYYTWENISIEELYFNTIDQVMTQPELLNSLTQFLNGTDAYNRLYSNPLNHNTDISGSNVYNEEPSFINLGNTFIPKKQGRIIKQNPDKIDDILEFLCYKLVEDENLPISKYEYEDNLLKIEHLGYDSFQRVISDLSIISSNPFKEGFNHTLALALSGVKIDKLYDKKLKNKSEPSLKKLMEELGVEKKELSDLLLSRQHERIAKATNSSSEEVSKNPYLYAMLKCLPNVTDTSILEPLANIINSELKNYQQWNINVRPTNAFLVNGKWMHTDLNRVRLMSEFEAHSMVVDSYLPLKNFMSNIPSNFNRYFTTILEPEHRNEIIKKIKENDPRFKKDPEAYFKKYSLGAFINTLNMADNSIKGLSKAKNFIDIIHNSLAYIHYRNTAMVYLYEIQSNYGINLETVSNVIFDNMNRNLNNALPKRVYDATFKWNETEDFREYITQFADEEEFVKIRIEGETRFLNCYESVDLKNEDFDFYLSLKEKAKRCFINEKDIKNLFIDHLREKYDVNIDYDAPHAIEPVSQVPDVIARQILNIIGVKDIGNVYRLNLLEKKSSEFDFEIGIGKAGYLYNGKYVNLSLNELIKKHLSEVDNTIQVYQIESVNLKNQAA